MGFKDHSINILEEAASTIRYIGPKKTLQALRDARSNSEVNIEEEAKEFIFKICCETFKVSRASLSGLARNERYDAETFIFVMLQRHLNYSLNQVRQCWPKPKDKGTVSRRISEFNRMDEDNPVDAKKLEIFNSINDKVIKFIEKITQPNYGKKKGHTRAKGGKGKV